MLHQVPQEPVHKLGHLADAHPPEVDALSVLGSLAADRPEPSPRIFMNLARGNVHGTEALLAAVQSGAIRRAAASVA